MSDLKSIAHDSFRVMEISDVELAQRIVAPDSINQEADDDPEDVERQ
ncbi:MAG TPA: hypothetical protein VFQ37_10555 [Mycobacterium sp.]|nr:hypothetical protein [Mycobacterium sp.]